MEEFTPATVLWFPLWPRDIWEESPNRGTMNPEFIRLIFIRVPTLKSVSIRSKFYVHMEQNFPKTFVFYFFENET